MRGLDGLGVEGMGDFVLGAGFGGVTVARVDVFTANVGESVMGIH